MELADEEFRLEVITAIIRPRGEGLSHQANGVCLTRAHLYLNQRVAHRARFKMVPPARTHANAGRESRVEEERGEREERRGERGRRWEGGRTGDRREGSEKRGGIDEGEDRGRREGGVGKGEKKGRGD